MFSSFFTNQNFMNICKLIVKNVIEVVIKTVSVAFIIPLLHNTLESMNSKFRA